MTSGEWTSNSIALIALLASVVTYVRSEKEAKRAKKEAKEQNEKQEREEKIQRVMQQYEAQTEKRFIYRFLFCGIGVLDCHRDIAEVVSRLEQRGRNVLGEQYKKEFQGKNLHDIFRAALSEHGRGNRILDFSKYAREARTVDEGV